MKPAANLPFSVKLPLERIPASNRKPLSASSSTKMLIPDYLTGPEGVDGADYRQWRQVCSPY
jgi:hypothetical protein